MRYIVGNKIDNTDDIMVSAAHAEVYATSRGSQFMEVSAKTNLNIKLLFEEICGYIR